MKTNHIYQGDCLEVLKTFPDESINCVVTSPPYWALRDYGVEGQLGLEPTFQEYITKLCDIFDEVKRVLRKDGTCWVNMGDTYGGSGNGTCKNVDVQKYVENSKQVYVMPNGTARASKMPSKCLLQIPSRFAIEMTNRGWILRNEIIWYKPNCMPSSVKDRFTVDFEKVFFFVKNKKYAFETQHEKANDKYKDRYNYDFYTGEKDTSGKKWINGLQTAGKKPYSGNRNKRCVWKVTTKPFKEAHFATYPEKLIVPMIKAGCPIDGVVLDPFFGAGTTGLVAKKQSKNYIGIELNKEYIEIANKRLAQQVLL